MLDSKVVWGVFGLGVATMNASMFDRFVGVARVIPVVGILGGAVLSTRSFIAIGEDRGETRGVRRGLEGAGGPSSGAGPALGVF